MTNTNREATAWHEAGHAVMAMMLGRPIEKVSILPAQLATGNRLGVCKIQKGRAKGTKDALEDSVLILLAGMVAESKFTGRYCQHGAAQDLLLVKELLTANRAKNEKQFQKLASRMIDKTEHLLEAEGAARAIQLIADELLEKDTVSGRAVRHFCQLADAKCR
ncbi:cell division protein FtsH [bacterium]|nr:cell division protein FtsH [bacterium]